MKKIFIAVLALFCLTTVSQAQTQQYYKLSHRNEISASYGVSLIEVGVGAVVNKGGDLFKFIGVDDIEIKNGGTKGWFTLGYTYQLNKTISVGANLSYTSMKVVLKDETDKAKSGVSVFTFMPTAKFDWFRTSSDVFGMYSKVALGVGLMTGQVLDQNLKGAIPFFSPHLSLIGLEVGKGFSGFLELGAGFEGIVQAGIRARF